jgi:hypothetical protein
MHKFEYIRLGCTIKVHSNVKDESELSVSDKFPLMSAPQALSYKSSFDAPRGSAVDSTSELRRAHLTYDRMSLVRSSLQKASSRDTHFALNFFEYSLIRIFDNAALLYQAICSILKASSSLPIPQNQTFEDVQQHFPYDNGIQHIDRCTHTIHAVPQKRS